MASVEPEDPRLQEIWYKILKGAKIGAEDPLGYPSFLSYLVFEKKQNSLINLLTAPPELIAVLFDDSFAETFVAEREVLFETLKNKNDETEILEKILQHYGKGTNPYRHLFTLYRFRK